MSSPLRVTNTSTTSLYPAVAVDSYGQSYVGWAEAYYLWYGWGQFLYYTKVDLSAPSQTSILLSGDVSGRIGEPAMTVGPGDILHILWHHNTYAAEEMFYRSISLDRTINPWARLTYTNSWNTDIPRVKVDSTNGIHITYSSETPHTWTADGTHYNLYYKKFQYNPATKSVSELLFKQLTFDGGIIQVGDLGVDSNGGVHIVYQDDGGVVNYTKLNGIDGSILIPTTQVSSISSTFPSIRVDSLDNIHIVWSQSGDIFYKKLDSNGNTLIANMQVTSDPASSTAPGIVVDSDNNPHIAWIDTRDGTSEIYYAMLSGVDGSKLIADVRVTDNDGFKSSWIWPAIVIDSNNIVHVAWQDIKDGNYEIYYRQISVAPKLLKVSVDIKPQSCPNPLNTKSKGVLSVAILGTKDFDVANVDIASIRLEGVAPIRINAEDVSRPIESQGVCNCTAEGGDGFTDLALKFNIKEIVDAIGEVADGEEIMLTLTGKLVDGTQIEGADCIVVISK